MNATIIIYCIIAYFGLLYIISWFTSRNANNDTYFTGNKNSPWYIIAFGMIGASLSGVTFVSVPGWVQEQQFSYMQMVLGYLPGYFIIAYVLMPLYYRLNLTTIYTYLDERFGKISYKTGASFFLLSRLMGSSLRMYLTTNVLQFIIFDSLGVPFWVTVTSSIFLIWLYTFKGGIKTIIWTDMFQTAFMLLAVVCTVYLIGQKLGWGLGEMIQQVKDSSYSKIFFFEEGSGKLGFFRQFLSGALIALVMTGLDQEMMQRNLTCRNIKEAQRNMVSFSIVLVFVNLIFMVLGAMLYIYAEKTGMLLPANGDDLYAMIASSGTLPALVGIFFVLGLIAAAYSGADSALTALTTSFCIDILEIEKKEKKEQESLRMKMHIVFSILTIIIIICAKQFHNKSLIDMVFRVASYTYGPLLGLFAFGLMSKRGVNDSVVPYIALLAPVISYYIAANSKQWFNGYEFGYEILLVNGSLTYLGLYLSGLEVWKKNKNILKA